MEYKTSGFGSNSDAVGRANYYSLQYVPTAQFNGGRKQIVGGGSGTFNAYLNAYNEEMTYESACSLSISGYYRPTTRELKVRAKVTAVDRFDKARLRYAIAESHIAYHWGSDYTLWLDSLHHVVRKMLPNYNGVAMPGMRPRDIFVDSQTYTLSTAWDDDNCYVVVFVQSDFSADKPVLRSAKSVPLTSGFGFDFTYTSDDTAEVGVLGDTTTFGSRLKNTGTEADSYVISMTENLPTPPEWLIYFCSGACGDTGIHVDTVYLDTTQQEVILVKMVPRDISGEANVTMTVTSLGSGVSKSITFLLAVREQIPVTGRWGLVILISLIFASGLYLILKRLRPAKITPPS